MMDLSSSVFMNFRRITTSTVNSCFTHDMQFCRMRNIIEDEDDVSLILILLLIVVTNKGMHNDQLRNFCEVLPHN